MKNTPSRTQSGDCSPREITRTLTVKGQVTVPKEVRELLGVKPRETIAFRVDNGRVELVPGKQART